jgi:hypothetical protein
VGHRNRFSPVCPAVDGFDGSTSPMIRRIL